MSDFQKPSQIDLIAAYKGLLDAQHKAIAARDAEAHEAADHEMRHFLRLLGMGRAQEWFTSRAATKDGTQ